MKKLLTLAAFGLFTMAAMAADRYPSVTIKSKRNFQIVVDGRSYSDNDNTIRLDRMRRGMHSISVYERSSGLFGRRMRLVSSKNFYVSNDDIRITIDRSGYVDVNEIGYGRRNDRNYNDRNRNWDRNDRDRRWNDNDDDDNDRDWNRNDRSHY